MIPIVLITGFLGSGKTTLLRNLMARYRDRRFFYVVNEFSQADVDGRLVESSVASERLEVLPGGSIFCTCLVSEFIRVLTAIPERLPSVEGVVIEASGMANPLSVEKLIRETRLDGRFVLASVLVVVDPITFPVLIHTLPNIVGQVQAADVVLLNKIDMVTEEQVATTETELARLRPDVVVHRVQHCCIDLDVFSPHVIKGLDAEYTPCVDPRYARFVLDFPRPVNIEAVTSALMHFGPDLYRAKGFVRIMDGSARYIDFASGIVTTKPAAAMGGGSLALIFAGSALQRAQNLLHTLRTSAA